MREVLRALRDQLQELDGLVSPLDDDGSSTPSACPGWTITDALLHLARTNEMAAASARGSLAGAGRAWSGLSGDTVDELAGAAVEAERGTPASEVHRRWRRSAEDMVAAFAGCRPELRATGPDAEPVLSLARTFA